MNNTKNVPEIRFKGCYDEDGNWVAFTHPWEQRKLSDVVDSVDTGKSKFDKEGSSGEYPILGSTSVIGYDDEYDYEGDFILTARVGANAGSLYRHAGKVKISDNTVFIQASQNIEFLYQLLIRFDIKRLSFGTGQPLVKASELKRLELMMPTDMEEQMRIGVYFKNLDHLITLHQQKVDLHEKYVRGVEQKLMSGEMRFKADDGSDFSDWEEKKLGAVCSYRRGSFPQPYGLDEWYDEINGKPFIQVADVNDDMKVNKTTKRYISKLAEEKSVFVESGTLIITLQGTIGRVAITTYDAYVDRTLLIIQNIDDCLNIEYLKLAMKSLFDVEKRKADGGIIKTITKETLTNFMFSIPCLDEQQKIADCLSVGYAVVEQDKIAIDALKKLKTYMLQKMFV